MSEKRKLRKMPKAKKKYRTKKIIEQENLIKQQEEEEANRIKREKEEAKALLEEERKEQLRLYRRKKRLKKIDKRDKNKVVLLQQSRTRVTRKMIISLGDIFYKNNSEDESLNEKMTVIEIRKINPTEDLIKIQSSNGNIYIKQVLEIVEEVRERNWLTDIEFVDMMGKDRVYNKIKNHVDNYERMVRYSLKELEFLLECLEKRGEIKKCRKKRKPK